MSVPQTIPLLRNAHYTLNYLCPHTLHQDLFCDIYYLRNLCNTLKFPSWPISHPVQLLKEVLGAWRVEVDKKPSTMTVDDAYQVLVLLLYMYLYLYIVMYLS